jgi:hypothetical protein
MEKLSVMNVSLVDMLLITTVTIRPKQTAALCVPWASMENLSLHQKIVFLNRHHAKVVAQGATLLPLEWLTTLDAMHVRQANIQTLLALTHRLNVKIVFAMSTTILRHRRSAKHVK